MRCAHGITVCTVSRARQSVLPRRAWPPPPPHLLGAVPAASYLFGPQVEPPRGSVWSVVAHRTLAGAGRAGVPFGATEGLQTSVFQLVLELLGISLLVSDSLTQGLVIAPSHVWTKLMEGWGAG